MTTTPRSVPERIRRPKPWRSRITASGSTYSPKGSRSPAVRARTRGSVGTAKGSLAISTHWRASPGTSIPSQKVPVPSRRVRGFSTKEVSSWRRVPSSPWPSTEIWLPARRRPARSRMRRSAP